LRFDRPIARVWTGLCLVVVLSASASLGASEPARVAPVRILLLGDSTVIGSVCRKAAPKADHLEDVIRKCLAAEEGVPPVEVVNQGRDGEYIEGLLKARYEEEIKPLGRFDVVLIRYGLNDRAKREGFAENFPKDYRALIARLKADNPEAKIIIETTIPYASPKREEEINSLVREVAKAEGLPLLDTHAVVAAALAKEGPNALTYHRVKLDAIPERLRPLLTPESQHVNPNEVIVMSNLLDAHFRDVPGWFGDRHPNPAGYHEIGRGVAEFLTPMLRAK
jgi:lysophospholipase L1-like esterase